MGIDGAEIKRRRVEREKHQAATVSPSTLPIEETKEHEKHETLSLFQRFWKGYTIVAKIAATALLVIVAIGMIREATEDSGPKHRSSASSQASPLKHLSSASQAGTSDMIVLALTVAYGNVCRAEITGIFSKTLKIDWTSKTTMLHAMKILAEIGKVKETLYEDGVRYFQFPNDTGTYNVIDWKTGSRESTSDRSPYYFEQ